MPKETEIEILYEELKKVVGQKYEKMKGFKIAPMREIDIVDYLSLHFFHDIDNFSNIRDIITEWEIVPLKNDIDIVQIFNRINQLKK